VDGRAVVKLLRGERLEPLDHQRRDVRVQLDDYPSVVRLDHGGLRVRLRLDPLLHRGLGLRVRVFRILLPALVAGGGRQRERQQREGKQHTFQPHPDDSSQS
jgi:hypothetical protein